MAGGRGKSPGKMMRQGDEKVCESWYLICGSENSLVEDEEKIPKVKQTDSKVLFRKCFNAKLPVFWR